MEENREVKMDIDRLCPGCMREVETEEQTAGQRDTGTQSAGMRKRENLFAEIHTAGIQNQKCPYCGFNAGTYRQNARCLPLYTILAGKYLVGAVLGEGGFGITYIGYDLNMHFEEKEEEFGETIVTPNPQTSYDNSWAHALILQDDGTVVSLGSNQYGQRNLSEWSRIAAVAAGDTFSAGLREDGKVVVAGELEGKDDVERWEGIVAISAHGSTLVGLTADGTVVGNTYNEARAEWKGIKAILSDDWSDCALTEDGRVLSTDVTYRTPVEISGWEDVRYITGNYKDLYGIKENGEIAYSPRWSDFTDSDPIAEDLGQFHGIVQLYVTTRSIFGVDENGELYVSGNNTLKNRDTLSKISGWKNLAGVTGDKSGAGRIAGIQKDGTILKISENFGNAMPEEMTGLEKVFLPESNISNEEITLAGVTGDGRLLYYSLNSNAGRLLDLSEVKEVGALMHTGETGNGKVYVYLDTAGNLWAENYDNLGSYGSAAFHLKQIICSPDNGGRGKYGIGGSYVAGLTEDGTVQFYQVGDYAVPEGIEEAEAWEDIIQLAGYKNRDHRNHGLLGLRKDGTVESIESDGTSRPEVAEWKDITAICSGSYAVGAIRSDGTPVFLEDNQEYNYGQYNTAGWTDLTQLAMGLYHTVGLKADGTVYATGRNDAGQCEVEEWRDIVYVAANDCCTVGIKSDGTLMIAGELGW